MQNIVAWSTSHVVEFMPGVTVFSVEVFDALYKCMQSAGSIATFVAIIVFDAFESVVAYRDMKGQTAHLYQLMKEYNATNPDKRFVDTVMAVCQEPDVLSRKDSNIRIRSPIKLSLSRQSTVLLKELIRTQSAALATADGVATQLGSDIETYATPLTHRNFFLRPTLLLVSCADLVLLERCD